jgi:hypothetical protein
MPNDLSVSDLSSHATAVVNLDNASTVPVKSAAPVKFDAPVNTNAPAGPVQHTAPLTSSAPNPTLELNAALGLVVIEFRNSTGTVTNTIPSQQQLQAYQQWQMSGVGSPPSLGGSATGVAAAPTLAASGDASRSKLLDVMD